MTISAQVITDFHTFPALGGDDWRYTFATARVRALEIGMLGRAMLGKLGLSGTDALKRGVSSAAGLLTSSLQGNPTWQYGVGAPFAGGQVTIDSQGGALQGNLLGGQRDTRGGGANWGESL